MIIGTVGLPRSGKTTFAKTIPGFVRVNRDQIRLSIYGQRYFRGGEQYVSAIANTMLDVLHQENNIILDECSLTFEMRQKHRQIIHWIYFNAWSDVCKKRAIDSGQPDLVDIIHNMNITIEPPMACLAVIDRDGKFVKSEKALVSSRKEFDDFIK